MPLIKSKQLDMSDLMNTILGLLSTNPGDNNKFSNLVNNVNTFVTSPSTAGPIQDIVISSITSSSASITWTAISGAINYDIEYYVKGNQLNPITISGIVTTTYTLANLDGATTYEINIKPNF